jgi:hypothetical protein
MAEVTSIIELFQLLLARKETITLTNVYKEVPIVQPGFVREVGDDRLVLETSELQIGAMHWGGGTVIQAALLSAPVGAQLDAIDIQRRLVTVSHFCHTEVPCAHRETVRVRLRKPLRLMLFDRSNAGTPGVIQDISVGGCLVRTGHNRPMEGDIMVVLEIEGESRQIAGLLLRVQGEAPAYNCTVSFQHTPESEQFISTFIHKRELEIMKELRNIL